jgi:hypothetical protein
MRYSRFIGVVGLVLMLARPLPATTVLEKNFADLVHEADTIVVGTVTAIETDQTQATPFTLVTFGDLDVVKGTHQDAEFTVHVMGGPAPDGMRLQIVGTPSFHLGDRMVLFVVGNATQAVPFVGMWQGVYRVVQDADDRETVTTHDGHPLTALPRRQTADGIVHDSHSLHAPMVRASRRPALTFDAFRQSIVEELHDGE